MKVLFSLSAVALLFILVRSADLAISAALGRSIVVLIALLGV
jgi:hypothetical protein